MESQASTTTSAELALPVGWSDGDGRRHREARLRKMTGHDEALLYAASRSAFERVSALLSACLCRLGPLSEVTPAIASELALADRDYLLVELRRISLGDRVLAVYPCPACGAENRVIEELSALDVRSWEGEALCVDVELEDGYRDRRGAVHRHVRLRPPRGDDLGHLEAVLARDPLRAQEVLLLRCIERLGDMPRAELEATGMKVLRDLSLADRHALRRAVDDHMPGIDFRRSIRCGSCGHRFTALLDTADFFSPSQVDTSASNARSSAWHGTSTGPGLRS